MSERQPMDYTRCPYLGKADDRASFYHQATRRHRCYRWEQPLMVRRQDQEQYCLASLHISCPRLTDPNALPVPEEKSRRRRRHSVRILGLPVRRFVAYTLPMVLLFAAAVTAAALLLQEMSAPPLPTALAESRTGEGLASATPTTTPFPTWTPTTVSGAAGQPAAPTQSLPVALPSDTPHPAVAPPSPAPPVTATPTMLFPTLPAATTTFSSPLTASPVWTPPPPTATLAATLPGTSAASAETPTPTVTPLPTFTPYPTAYPGSVNFVLKGEPVKQLVPGGVDVCAKVFGRVYNEQGINITPQLAVAVDWWPDNRLVVGEEGWPPINADGTYEFCLTRGQFNLSVVAPKTTSQQVWIDLDELNFVGQIILEVNFQKVK